jgi:hypothetical protein
MSRTNNPFFPARAASNYHCDTTLLALMAILILQPLA